MDRANFFDKFSVIELHEVNRNPVGVFLALRGLFAKKWQALE
jgi:hypothetical protein